MNIARVPKRPKIFILHLSTSKKIPRQVCKVPIHTRARIFLITGIARNRCVFPAADSPPPRQRKPTAIAFILTGQVIDSLSHAAPMGTDSKINPRSQTAELSSVTSFKRRTVNRRNLNIQLLFLNPTHHSIKSSHIFKFGLYLVSMPIHFRMVTSCSLTNSYQRLLIVI